jgi:hypothetical protein
MKSQATYWEKIQGLLSAVYKKLSKLSNYKKNRTRPIKIFKGFEETYHKRRLYVNSTYT